MDCPALAVPVASVVSVALVVPAASAALVAPAASAALAAPVALVESGFLQMGCPALEVLALSPAAVFQPALMAEV